MAGAATLRPGREHFALPLPSGAGNRKGTRHDHEGPMAAIFITD